MTTREETQLRSFPTYFGIEEAPVFIEKRHWSAAQNRTRKRNLAASLVIALIVLPEPITTVLGVMLVCIWWGFWGGKR